MNQTDVLVVGGSAAGIVAATTAKSFHPDKRVMLVRREKQVLVPCGIPYMFGTLENSDKNVIPDANLENAGVELVVDEVDAVDPEQQVCTFSNGSQIGFEKLVLATGSVPIKPGWLNGLDFDNVFIVPKSKPYLDSLMTTLDNCQQVVVIGGGFIGVELADEIARNGRQVSIVELLPHVLSLAFDDELCIRAEEVLTRRGVELKCGQRVVRIEGHDRATGVKLDSGEVLDADAVILSVGYRPNSDLARKAGIQCNEMGFIKVNEYMRTDYKNIFAAGDCAEKFSFITRTPKGTMLASTSGAEARIAGMNLYQLSKLRSFQGTISIFCTAIGQNAFGAAGVTEKLAAERGFEIVTGLFEGVDSHPATLPDSRPQLVKLIASVDSGILLGGEVVGGKSTGELTNLIGFLIQNRMTIDGILTSQIGTHPLLTASPTAYPLIKAAEVIAKKRKTVLA
ncbi:MAG: FAD-dependent oxidoreductase [Desulfosalsimonas sp.]|uniref:FAD-dependent oxidoreductase n=1 Tax=Desulfosalsimonas sp. TaxID=3073848 RepID=UPI0039709487